MKKNKITPRMTESYYPYANAVAERVNGILKQEKTSLLLLYENAGANAFTKKY